MHCRGGVRPDQPATFPMPAGCRRRLLVALLVALPAAAAPRHAPSTGDLEFATGEDAVVQATVPATDSDHHALRFRLLRPPAHGQATLDQTTGALSYAPARDFHGDDAFAVEVSDGRRAAKAAVKVRVAPVNDAPVARPVSLTTREDTAVHGASSARDVDGDALTFQLAAPPAHGTASVDARSGALTYQPAPDAAGSDAFQVEVSDGTATVTFEVDVTVLAVNDAPVALAAAYSLDEDAALQGTLAARDVDGDAIAFRLTRRPKHGELQLDARTGAFTYRPARDSNGPDAFAFQASDGRLQSEATVALEVRAVNDAPVASPLALATREDTAVQATAAATDVDRDALTWRLSRPPSHGTAAIEPKTGALSYQPAPDFNGADAFAVEVSDGQLTAPSEVSVAVAPVNDAPVAERATFSLDEDTPLSGQLVAGDVDADALTWRLAARPAHGEATVDAATGALRYAPARDFFGDDALSVEVSDGRLVATAAVTLHVLPVNDAPLAQRLSLATPEDVPARGKVVASDVDSALTFTVAVPARHGEARVEPGTGAVTYLPAPDFNGADTFTVQASDGALSALAEVSVAIAPVDNPPAFTPPALAVDEDGRLAEALSAHDVEGDALTWRLVALPRHGAAALEPATGRLTYVPARDFFGDDALAVEVSDGQLRTTANLRVLVRPVNDAPVARPLSLATREDTAARGTVVATDVDSTLTYRVSGAPRHGAASVDATGAVTYQPAADFNGADAFTVEASDGELSAKSEVTVAVAAVDDPPVVHAATLETPEDTAAEATLPATEADGERLTFHLLSAPRLGAAVLVDAHTGAWRFTPGPDLNGDDELAFDVSDGKTTVAGVLRLHVTAVSDAPTLAGLALNTLEDRAVEGQLEAKDVDGDALTYLVTAQPKSGRAVVLDAAKGLVRFEPARDFNGATSFTVAVTDGKLESAPATVTVSVQPQNDAPVAAGAQLGLDEDGVLRGRLGATDVDGDPLTFQLVTAPGHGTLKLTDAATGTFEYVPAPNYFGPDAFDFSAADPAGASSTATVRLAVNPVNNPPVAMPDTISAPYRGMITGRLKGYDRESGSVTFRIVDQPAHGVLRLLDARTGEFTFSTDGDSSEESTARFVVSDGSATSQPAEVDILIRSM